MAYMDTFDPPARDWGLKGRAVDFLSGCLGMGVIVAMPSAIILATSASGLAALAAEAGVLTGGVSAVIGLGSQMVFRARSHYHLKTAERLVQEKDWEKALDHADRACFLFRNTFLGQSQGKGLLGWRVALEENIQEDISRGQQDLGFSLIQGGVPASSPDVVRGRNHEPGISKPKSSKSRGR